MCRQYTINGKCGHTRLSLRACNAHTACAPLTMVTMKTHRRCETCSEAILSYMGSMLVPRDVPLLRAKASQGGLEEACVRTSLLVENLVPTPAAAGTFAPFLGRITKDDGGLLLDVHEYVEVVLLRRPGNEPIDVRHEMKNKWMRLLKTVGRVLECADIELLEDGFFGMQCVLDAHSAVIEGTPSPWRTLCAPVDVLDLEKGKRDCGLCYWGLASEKEGDSLDRVEEKPVKLPCGHVYGSNKCIHTHFGYNGATCPTCRAGFLPANYCFDREDVVTPWWMKHVRGESVD
ncbi:hypothetical protein N431DRAFT_521752 [Stipitochalara longipes BDJ]|nr:hypothetical protein N431DRAFT_521752 [Stipitochalara longipes BDJ]